ncbi:MAG: ATPase, T2SS/T4P/T4SS family [Verrucomicrobiota bacterium]
MKKTDDKSVVDVLKHARLITEQQLERAYKEQKVSGASLRDILFRDLSWDSVKSLLNYEEPRSFTSGKRVVGDVLREAEWITQEQHDEIERESQRTGAALGQTLVNQKLLTPPQLERALAEQKKTGLPLWRTLINLGFVSTQQVSQALGIQTVAGGRSSDTQNLVAIAGKMEKTGAASSILGDAKTIARMSAVDLVEAIVDSAVESRATDIHMDPQEEHLRVRFRIDGMLYDILQLPVQIVPEVVSRFKVLGGMDITQRRHSQEGHFVREVRKMEIDLRLSTAPTVLGEKLCVRILNEKNVVTGIAQLGMEPHQIDLIESLMAKPYGMILTTGPVGSGKTTTLYTLLNEVNILTRNVMTIEDPVEYQLRGVNQMQVDLPGHFGFVQGLRAILRQDPNIVMVGEIRDEETAMTAMKAAMTGMLVLTTLHTNDAPAAVGSLLGLNVSRFLISTAVIGVAAQRLIRKLCPNCKTEYRPDKGLLELLHVPADQRDQPFFKGTGCEKCLHTGYYGRAGIFEIMAVGDEIKESILHDGTLPEFRRLALDGGMQTLAQSALNKVLDGTTTSDEYLRVIFT